MSAHTPGPWEAVLPGDPRGQPVPYYAGLVALVSHDPSISVVTEGGYSAAKEWEANARLIAAAPDLLAAAQRALVALQGAGDQADPARSALIAAIAKADWK